MKYLNFFHTLLFPFLLYAARGIVPEPSLSHRLDLSFPINWRLKIPGIPFFFFFETSHVSTLHEYTLPNLSFPQTSHPPTLCYSSTVKIPFLKQFRWTAKMLLNRWRCRGVLLKTQDVKKRLETKTTSFVRMNFLQVTDNITIGVGRSQKVRRHSSLSSLPLLSFTPHPHTHPLSLPVLPFRSPLSFPLALDAPCLPR